MSDGGLQTLLLMLNDVAPDLKTGAHLDQVNTPRHGAPGVKHQGVNTRKKRVIACGL